MSDTPGVIRNRPRLRPRMVARLEDVYRRRLRSLQSVDDLVDSVVTTLRQTGQLARTYIAYGSDNGFHRAVCRARTWRSRGSARARDRPEQ